jgi:hypothetical protein
MTKIAKNGIAPAEIEAITALAELQAEDVFKVEQVREKSPPIDAANLEQIADFPLDVLPESIAKHITLASEMHIAPADYLAIGYLATLATFAGSLYEIKSDLTCIGEDGGQQYGNNYFVLIGDSSDGKSKALKEFLRPALAVDRKMKDDFKLAAARYRKDLRQFRIDVKKNPNAGEPIPPEQIMYYTNKCTTAGLLAQVERNGNSGKPLVLYVDEMKGLLDKAKGGGHSVDLISVLIDLHQQSQITITLKGSTQDGHSVDNITDIVNSALTFVGGIQKRAIKALINDLTIAQGFAPRLLYTSSKFEDRPFVMPTPEQSQELKAHREKWANCINELHQLCEKNVHLAQAGQKYRQTFHLDATAVQYHAAFEAEHVAKMNAHRKANEPELREMIAKHREIVLRLTLLLHIGDHVSQAPELAALHPISIHVSAATFERACRLQQYFEQQALKALDKDVNVHPRELLPIRVQQWFAALPNSFTLEYILHDKAQAASNEAANIGAESTQYKWVKRLRDLKLIDVDRTGVYNKI